MTYTVEPLTEQDDKQLDYCFELKTDCIHFLPRPCMYERYSELEDFYILHYRNELTDKITRLVFKIMAYFPVKIFYNVSIENNEENLHRAYREYENLNLAKFDFEFLSSIIYYIMHCDKCFEISILFEQYDILLHITGDRFDATFYGLDTTLYDFIVDLVKSEGLFIYETPS